MTAAVPYELPTQQPRRLPEGRVAWKPNPGPQTRALKSAADELLFGGATGGGKTDFLLAAAQRYVHVASYRAVIFRRTEKDLRKPDGLLERAWKLYGATEAKPTNGGLTWIWPSGARIDLAGMEHEKDRFKWKGAQLQFIGWDELTEFTEVQYLYMWSRLRGTAGLPTRVRATSNPGGEGHDWVLARFAPWLYPEDRHEYKGPRAKDGARLFYVYDEKLKRHRVETTMVPRARSRTFIASRLGDTPQLDQQAYVDNLNELDAVTRERYVHGDWMVREEAGTMFQRAWWAGENAHRIIAAPHTRGIVSRFRYWDLASTEKKLNSKNAPAATASARGYLLADGTLVVEEVTQSWLSPGGVEDLVLECARADRELYGERCPTCIEHDPGQAGVAQKWSFSKLLSGFTWHSIKPTGDKVERARPVSAAAEHGRLLLVRGPWNQRYIDELVNFPTVGLKDQVDATSGLHLMCTTRREVQLPPPGPPTRLAAIGRGGF